MSELQYASTDLNPYKVGIYLNEQLATGVFSVGQRGHTLQSVSREELKNVWLL